MTKKVTQPLILIIEDEPALADIYRIELEGRGCAVLHANDGVKGLTMAVERHPNVIVLDVLLPIKDGFAVLKDLRENPATRPIPVVMLTNLSEPYEHAHGKRLGAHSVHVKAELTPRAVGDMVMQQMTDK